MSSIKTTVQLLENVRPHPNADALNLSTVLGWQMVLQKDERQTGDKIVYFEAGTVLPQRWAEEFNVIKYLSEKVDINGDRVLVVGKVKLRGEASFGLAIPVPAAQTDWEVGQDVSEYYGTSKYRPPVKAVAGDAEDEHPQFVRYTDIENLRNYPDVFVDGEEVEITEKLHGTNCRIGFVTDTPVLERRDFNRLDERFSTRLELMAGSRELRRKDPGVSQREKNTYWFPWATDEVENLMRNLFSEHGADQAILYGEVYGSKIQKGFTYGAKQPSFRVFCLMINGQFVDVDRRDELMKAYNVPLVPVLYRGPYSFAKVKELSEGQSALGGNIREGVVVRPVKERTDPRIGRVILKYVSDQFLFRKNADIEDTTDQ